MRNWAQARVSGASLGIFRILFGLFIVMEACFFWLGRAGYFPQQEIHFKYVGLERWPVLTPLSLKLSLIALALTGLLILAGVWVRVAAAGVVGVVLHLLLQDAGFFLNHLLLVILVAFVFCWVPTNRAFALYKSKSLAGDQTLARYELVWVVALFLLTYEASAIEKLRPEWFSGDILLVNFGLSARNGNWLGDFMYAPYPILIATWGIFLVELLAPLGILYRKTRWVSVGLLAVFHVFNHLTFNLGLSSFLMLSALVLYFDPAWPTRLSELRIKGWRRVK